MPKIIYNKVKSGRLLGGGGPRDRQTALKLEQQRELFSTLRPAMTAEVSKSKTVSEPKQAQQEVDLSQYLPLKEVKKKIEEAVIFTRNKEQQRFESGLKNINNQLKAERKKAAGSGEELLNAKVEIKRLKTQITEVPVIPMEVEKRIMEKDSEISKLNTKLTTKSELYDKVEKEITALQNKIEDINKSDGSKDENIGKLKADLDNKSKLCRRLKEKVQRYTESASTKEKKLIELTAVMKTKEEEFGRSNSYMTELQEKMDKLYDKIADGSIQSFVGSKMDRPMLEDKIFIDPLEKDKEPDLDAHIDIKEEESVKEVDSDMMTDLSKLKGLLNLD